MRCVTLALCATCMVATSALAQTSPESGRYSMTPAEGGFLRLDTRTGDVTFCRPLAETVECRAAANERTALEAEIDRLGKENAELKSRLAGTKPAPGLQEDMNRALDFAERFMRRMMRMMREETPPERT